MVNQDQKSHSRAKRILLRALIVVLIAQAASSTLLRTKLISNIFTEDQYLGISLMKVTADPLSETCLFSRIWYSPLQTTFNDVTSLYLYNIRNDTFYQQPETATPNEETPAGPPVRSPVGGQILDDTAVEDSDDDSDNGPTGQFYNQTVTKRVANSALISSTKMIVCLKNPTGNSGSITFFDFDGDLTSSPDTSFDEAIDDITNVDIQVSHEKNLIAVSTVYSSGVKLRFYNSVGFTRGAFTDFTDLMGDSDSKAIAKFYPELDNYQMILAGDQEFSLIDITKVMVSNTVTLTSNSMIVYDLDSVNSGVFSEDTTLPSSSQVNSLEFNDLDSDYFMATVWSPYSALEGSFTRQIIGYYFKFKDQVLTIVSRIDERTKNNNFQTTRDCLKKIPLTNRFFMRLVRYHSTVFTASRIYLLESEPLGATGFFLGKILVNRQLKPYGVGTTNYWGSYILDMVNIESSPSKWIITGWEVSNGAVRNNWASIVKIRLHDMEEECHPDCASCIAPYEDYSETSCSRCANGRKIFVPSGCECSANCMSCVENKNENRCTTCAIGYYLELVQGDTNYGRCVEAGSTLTQLETDIEALGAEITDKEKSTGDLETRKTALEGSRDLLIASEISVDAPSSVVNQQSELSTGMTIIWKKYKEYSEEMKKISPKFTSLTTLATTLETSYDTIKDKNTAISTALGTLTTKYGTVKTSFDSVAAKEVEISTVDVGISSKLQGLSVLNKELSDLNDGILKKRTTLIKTLLNVLEKVQEVEEENQKAGRKIEEIDLKTTSTISKMLLLMDQKLSSISLEAQADVQTKLEADLTQRLATRQEEEAVLIEKVRTTQLELELQDSDHELLRAMTDKLLVLVDDNNRRRRTARRRTRELIGQKNKKDLIDIESLMKKYKQRGNLGKND